jgi:WD40 repeat protein
MARIYLFALAAFIHVGAVAAASTPVPGRTLFTIHPAPVGVAFSPDGKWLTVGGGVLGKAGAVSIWDLATGKEWAAFKGHTDLVLAVAVAPDSKVLASAGWDGSVRLWRPTGKELANLGRHRKQVRCLAFSPDGKLLASGSADEAVNLWDVAARKLRATLQRTGGATVAFSPDGKTLATGDDAWKPTVKLWDVATLQEKAALRGHTNRMPTVVFSPGGDTLATVSWDLTPRLWNVATGRLKARLQKHNGSVQCVAYSPDGKRLATACNWRRLYREGGSRGGVSKIEEGSQVKLWDASRGRALLTFEPDVIHGKGPRLIALRFGRGGKTLITVGDTGTVKEWDLTRWAAKPGADG